MGRVISSVIFVFAVAAAIGQSPAGSKAPGAGSPAAATSPQAAPAAAAPRPVPSPTPTPPKLNPGVAPAPIGGPQYSPPQLDFGSLWEGESATRTVTLTPPMNGIVTVSFPGGGGFWLTEYRVFGPPSGSKNDGIRQNGPISQWQLKSRSPVAVRKSIPGYYPQVVTAGDQIQVDFVFYPVSHPKGILPSSEAPGPKSIEIVIIGPGSTKFWSVKIPLHGVFNGPKTQSLSAPGDAEEQRAQVVFGPVWRGDMARQSVWR